jgi:hypothetical protein
MRYVKHLSLLLLLAFSPLCFAGTVFNNLIGGDQHGQSWYSIGTSAQYAPGFQFSPNASVDLATIGVALTRPGGNPATGGDVDISLYGDVGGLPGTLLESWTVAYSSLPDLDTNGVPHTGGIVTLTAVNTDPLVSGSQYWLVARETQLLTGGWGSAAWALTSSALENYITYTTSGSSLGATSTPGAFYVTGEAASSSTPEPATVLLLATGLAGVFGMTRKKRSR